MKSYSFWRSVFVSVLSLALLSGVLHPASAAASIVILSRYSASLSVGEEFLLAAVSSNGKRPAFKSSDSRVASVTSYGRVTAKRAGSCRITAKVASGEASCLIRVKKTQISMNSKAVSLENGESFRLRVTSSSNGVPVFSSNRKSVAVVDSDGLITACKPGDAVITVKVDQAAQTCRVTVKKPTLRLSRARVDLFRCQKIRLEAKVSSGRLPVWKSNRSGVATVDDDGMVVAQKHGTARITARVDGVSKTCEVVVRSPSIQLEADSLTMAVGERKRLRYTVSSGNAPVVRSSRPGVVTVDGTGNLTAKSPGTSIISFSEDGARETCTIHVSA